MGEHALLHTVILLVMAVVTVAISRRFHFPPILSYIIVGIIVGPYSLGWIENEENIHFLAEFGIVFLLFSIGLEFSLNQMWAMRKLVFGLGAFQVGITAIIFYFIVTWLGMDTKAAIVIGAAFALSSTAIVIKQLIEQSELQTRHGKATVGILIFQDLMAIPLLILIPSLGKATGDGQLAQELFFALINGLIVGVVIFIVGRYLLRPLFHEVAAAKSAELFTLAVLTVVLSAAAFTEEMGISMTLGAFIAGIMLGETEYKHQIEADIRPFQDILLGLFFVTIGMMISPDIVFNNLGQILLLSALIFSVKLSTIFIIVRVFQNPSGVSLRTALSLAQVGEFGLVLMSLAFSDQLLPKDFGQLLLTAAVISMMYTPFLIKFNGAITKRIIGRSYLKNIDEQAAGIEHQTHFTKNHVVILGFGRVGQTVAKFLEKNALPYVALDLDIHRVKEAQESGEPVFFGDSANPAILKAAHLQNAKSAIITFNDYHAALKALNTIKQIAPNLPVLVRTTDDTHLDELLQKGATEVIPETFESSIMLASHLLIMLGVPPSKVLQEARQVRQNRYSLLDSYYAGIGETAEAQHHQIMKNIITPVSIEASNPLIGQTLSDIPFSDYNVQLKAITHNGIRGENPSENTIIHSEDKLIIKGTPQNIAQLEKAIHKGKFQSEKHKSTSKNSLI